MTTNKALIALFQTTMFLVVITFFGVLAVETGSIVAGFASVAILIGGALVVGTDVYFNLTQAQRDKVREAGKFLVGFHAVYLVTGTAYALTLHTKSEWALVATLVVMVGSMMAFCKWMED